MLSFQLLGVSRQLNFYLNIHLYATLPFLSLYLLNLQQQVLLAQPLFLLIYFHLILLLQLFMTSLVARYQLHPELYTLILVPGLLIVQFLGKMFLGQILKEKCLSITLLIHHSYKHPTTKYKLILLNKKKPNQWPMKKEVHLLPEYDAGSIDEDLLRSTRNLINHKKNLHSPIRKKLHVNDLKTNEKNYLMPQQLFVESAIV
mmetsp:Transcript_23498/g.30547  ORF Transcript_23498/g.30547 Transcript_23498/m.30547 type:complete len:202 (+) Transcript_23498:1202-1807(+)